MDEKTTERLVAINRTFYERFFSAFDETRTAPWPGWYRVLDHVQPKTTSGPPTVEAAGGEAPSNEPHRDAIGPMAPGHRSGRVLDLGCGNGRFARFLAAHSGSSWTYEGWDNNDGLLEKARKHTAPLASAAHFQRVDLLGNDWPPTQADLVVAFGLLHHVPGHEGRRRLLRRAVACLAPGGMLAVSFWQFAPDGEPRVATAPWSEGGIDPVVVEPGDYLVRWRRGGDGLRYCHHTPAREVDALLETGTSKLTEIDRFNSDGASGDMNLYTVLRPEAP